MQSRAELLAAVGSRTRRASALRPIGGGNVIGLALTRQKNPGAPRTIVIAGTARARADADQMVASGEPLPVWLRPRPGHGWTFMGRWRPWTLDTGPDGLTEAYAAAFELEPLDHPPPAGVLRLRPVGDVIELTP